MSADGKVLDPMKPVEPQMRALAKAIVAGGPLANPEAWERYRRAFGEWQAMVGRETMPVTATSAEERRARFYAEEAHEQQRRPRSERFRCEEPNVRVWARGVDALLGAARNGLSEGDFRRLAYIVRDMLAHIPAEGTATFLGHDDGAAPSFRTEPTASEVSDVAQDMQRSRIAAQHAPDMGDGPERP